MAKKSVNVLQGWDGPKGNTLSQTEKKKTGKEKNEDKTFFCPTESLYVLSGCLYPFSMAY